MCLNPIATSPIAQPLPQETKTSPVKGPEPQAVPVSKPSQDRLAPLPSLGTATPVSFVDSLKPGSFSLGPDALRTKIDLEELKTAPGQPRTPLKLKAESRLDEALLKFNRGQQQASLKIDGLFKASLDGAGQGESAIFSHEPTGIEGQVALRQDLKVQSGRLKYQSQLFTQQSLTPLFKQQALPEANYGATASLSYDSGPAMLGFELREDALGADHYKTRLDLKQGALALSLSLGQETPVKGPASENLKAGLSYASGRTRLSTEAVSIGKDQKFGQASLSHSLAYQLGKGWDLKLGARPQAKENEQRLSFGLQGKF